jgi:hypothetical protein
VHLPGDPAGDARPVAREEHQPRNPHSAQPIDGAGRLRTGVVLEADPAEMPTPAYDVEHRQPVGVARGPVVDEPPGVGPRITAHHFRDPRSAADPHHLAVRQHGLDAPAGDLREPLRLRHGNAGTAGHFDDGPGHGMPAPLLGRRGGRQQLRGLDAVDRRQP